jgi:hypothetical protein
MPVIVRKLRPESATARWALTIAVILAPIAWGTGIAVRMSGYHVGDRVGRIVAWLCIFVVLWFKAFRSRPIYPTDGPPLDEREISLRRLALVRGMAIVAMSAVLICFYMNVALLSDWWTPSANDWAGLLTVEVGWMIGVPLAVANWQGPAPLDDEDEDNQ